ncbi:hypothetical protein KEM52_005061, partial [Ascosphaera acerosa]
LRRTPSELKRYRIWSARIKQEYGSVATYMVRERLGWPDVSRLRDEAVDPTTPFGDPRDYRILRNDWPYGFVPGIAHMCVWLKNDALALKPNGDMTDDARALVEAFVQRTFVARLRELFPDDYADRVVWFKNWAALQSVKALQHIHVMTRDVPEV